MNITRTDVDFISRGAKLRGWLYRPKGSLAAPGIVMAHGLTAVREMFLDRYAEAFAEAGFVTLAYDHFGFGVSDGEPRQSPTPSWQLEGYRDAINWLRRQAGVDSDQIGIWGSSFSGGQVIMLASEILPISCAVAQAPAFGGGPGQVSAATMSAIGDALQNGRFDEVIPAVSESAEGLGLLYPDNSYDWFTRVHKERAPSWRNEIRVGALVEPFEPIEFLPKVRIPLRLVVAPDNKLALPNEGIKVASTNPLIDTVRIAGGHFDGYESRFAETSGHAVDWFTRHLKA